MKTVLIGLGSIGLRHLRNILELGYKNVSIVKRDGVLPNEFSHLDVYSTLSAAISSTHFDAAVICTPTAYHASSLKALLEARVPNIYIEKPVSHSSAGMYELLTLSQSYTCNIIVGYDLHFDKGLQKVKELLTSNAIGTVVSANAQVGQYLPDWRPHEDYRQGMSAKKETGGGVMLDLIHEFDYLLWIMGDVSTVACQYSNSGTLKIETEDLCEVLLRFESNAIATIHLDYLQQKLVRNCMFTGSAGSVFWNLAENNVRWINKERQEETYDYKGFERNDRFVDIMQAFLENKKDTRLTSLENGLKSLKLVEAAKYSADNLAFVQLQNRFAAEQ